MITALPVIGVMGSGVDAHEDLAAPLGRLLASLQAHLLTGGGHGVMRAVARAFVEAAPPGGRRGLSLGVLPALNFDTPTQMKAGYPNPYVEIAVRTHLPAASTAGPPGTRNPINILSSDVVVALPGGRGTRMEMALAVEYGRPLARYLRAGEPSADTPPQATVCTDLDAMRVFLETALAAHQEESGGSSMA